MVLLALSAAIDMVYHTQLLTALSDLGVQGTALDYHPVSNLPFISKVLVKVITTVINR